MTPQQQVPQPGPQKSWFERNWYWVVGGGCLGLALCCGVFSLFGVGLTALGVAQEEAEKNGQQQDQAGRTTGSPTDKPVVKVTGADGARVDCGTPGPSGVDCDVKRTGGASALKVCWDLDITCTNGSVMTASTCGELAAGAAASVTNMPVADFSNQDKCDAPARGEVKNLVVTVE